MHACMHAGGHMMRQQIATFKHAWPMVAEGGVWLTEDTATSYDGSLLADGRPLSVAEFGGGYGKNDTWCPIHSDPMLPTQVQQQSNEVECGKRCSSICADDCCKHLPCSFQLSTDFRPKDR